MQSSHKLLLGALALVAVLLVVFMAPRWQDPEPSIHEQILAEHGLEKYNEFLEQEKSREIAVIREQEVIAEKQEFRKICKEMANGIYTRKEANQCIRQYMQRYERDDDGKPPANTQE